MHTGKLHETAGNTWFTYACFITAGLVIALVLEILWIVRFMLTIEVVEFYGGGVTYNETNGIFCP